MLDDLDLTQLLKRTDIIQKDKILLILYASSQSMSVVQIRDKGIRLGFPEIQRWKVSSLLGQARGLSSKIKDNWGLQPKGREYLERKSYFSTPAQQAIKTNLHSLVAKNRTQITKDFLEEAIACYESKYYRATIVLSWAGAMHVLREYVVTYKISDFNSVASIKTQGKWKPAKDEDDLGKMGDRDFLEILDKIGLIDKGVKINLQNYADTRNACAHPSSLVILDNQAAGFLESLIIHVFVPFS